MSKLKEGSLKAAVREPIAWQEEDFWNPTSLEKELERVYDICHGCRRCVNLCDSFPTLFNLVDESSTMEVDGVDKSDYMKVVDQCYLCDLCAETKCPYMPPHEWAVDFPHLMLRAKAQKFANKETKWRDRLISSTDKLMRVVGAPGLAPVANAVNNNKLFRKALEKTAGIHVKAPLPVFHSKKFKTSKEAKTPSSIAKVTSSSLTTGKVAFFTTCYGNTNEPSIGIDFKAIFEHNDIEFSILQRESCCGMPKFEIGDLNAVAELTKHNFPILLAAINSGYDIIAPIPSCVLMFKQEIPLMFPDDNDAQTIKKSFFDPFEYLQLRYKANLLKTDFTPLGKHIAYHVACHQRVQSMGLTTRYILQLIPDTTVTLVERCSGHDGSYALRAETYDKAIKIARPTVAKMKKANADTYISDCPMAGRFLGEELGESVQHPASLLRRAYGI